MYNQVVYEIYVKSFADSNGDGYGDLLGIVSKLDYLQELGVDYLWLTPIYVSPQADNGYDVADYYQIDPIYGKKEDLQLLIKEADQRGMKIMLDMVFNHTSTAHSWFQKAREGDEFYQKYYIWNDEPLDWESKFGGSAWEYDEKVGKYYLHLFDKTQADLNWENANVRSELYDVVNYWLDFGIKGFRFDVINLISKHYPLSNGGKEQYTDGPRIHEFLQEMRVKTFQNRGDIMTIGEMSSTNVDNCIKYANNNKSELDMVFHFHHLKVDYLDGEKWNSDYFSCRDLYENFKHWQETMNENKALDSLFWSNHDQPRIASRFIPARTPEEQVLKNKMLATSMYLQRGVCYLYQGEEIGMENMQYLSNKPLADVESLNFYQSSSLPVKERLRILSQKSRDNARTPMQWTAGRNAGFSRGKPWLGVNPNYKRINAQQYESKLLFDYYKNLFHLKKSSVSLTMGKIKFRDYNDDFVIAYERFNKESFYLIICNYGTETVNYSLEEKYELVLSNYERLELKKHFQLQAFEALVLKKKKENFRNGGQINEQKKKSYD